MVCCDPETQQRLLGSGTDPHEQQQQATCTFLEIMKVAAAHQASVVDVQQRQHLPEGDLLLTLLAPLLLCAHTHTQDDTQHP